jgi:hypothetical protein
MDLNGDGLLTADEYRRWLKMQQAKTAPKKADGNKPRRAKAPASRRPLVPAP